MENKHILDMALQELGCKLNFSEKAKEEKPRMAKPLNESTF